MKIERIRIKIGDLVDGYEDNPETNQVLGFHRKLDIRPPYQREFVYKDNQRNEVIYTVIKKFPLDVMYWATKLDGNFEIIDANKELFQFVNL